MAEPARALGFTEDRLLGGRVVVRQPRDGFRVAIDSVLLAASVPAQAGETVIELGAGGGAAALCLAARVEGCRVVGLERDHAAVRLASENIALNEMQRIVDVMVGDVGDPPPRLEPGGYAHAMANPPHLPPGRADASPLPGRSAGRVEDSAGLDVWISAMLRMVQAKGTLTLIHRADRLAEILAALNGRAGEIVVFPLWPGAGKPAKRVLVSARKSVAGPTRLSPGLVLHGPGGGYTPEADAVLRGAPLAL